MKTLWLWLTGGWRWFRPGFCTDCRQWTLVFRHDHGDQGRCESCWLDLK